MWYSVVSCFTIQFSSRLSSITYFIMQIVYIPLFEFTIKLKKKDTKTLHFDENTYHNLRY